MNGNEPMVLQGNNFLRALSERMKLYQNPLEALSKELRSHTEALKPLSLAINEAMLQFENPLKDLSKHLQSQTHGLLPFSAKLRATLTESFRPIIPPNIAADIAKAMQPSIDSWKEVSVLLSEHFKSMNGIQIAFRNELFDTVKLNALATAFQVMKPGQTDGVRPFNNLSTTVNDLSLKDADDESIMVDKLDIIIETIGRIENSISALNGKSTINEKLLSIEAIWFYISLLMTVVMYFDQKKDQAQTSEKLEIIRSDQEKASEQQMIFNNKIDTVNARLELIFEELGQLNRRICVRNTYIWQKPNTKSKIVILLPQFEVITLDTHDVTIAHKWLKIKYLDTKSDSVKCGWVLKKYFQKY